MLKIEMHVNLNVVTNNKLNVRYELYFEWKLSAFNFRRVNLDENWMNLILAIIWYV
jgi:hypothetical protein